MALNPPKDFLRGRTAEGMALFPLLVGDYVTICFELGLHFEIREAEDCFPAL
jgi:hypothetical protein